MTVITPSRLHFALIDLNGELGRIDGSIGLTLASPSVRVHADRARGWEVHGEVPPLILRRVHSILRWLQEERQLPGARLELRETIPLHVGLGAGTQLALGVARAVYGAYDLEWDTHAVAKSIGRGGTSGIGVTAFDSGGFILDGGHRFPAEKASFLPSSAAKGVPLPPVLMRYVFPDWPVLLVLPNCRHISGEDEIRRFQTLCPISPDTAERNCHIILMQLLPAILERDLDAFGESLNRLQEIGWKRVEHEAQGIIVGKTREFLLSHGAVGVALSSWGPTLAAFGEDIKRLHALAEDFVEQLPEGGRCILTHANNEGAHTSASRQG